MPSGHGWKAKPGWKIVVVARGAVRFDIPREWPGQPTEEGSIRIHDRMSPDDNCQLEASLLPYQLRSGAGPSLTELLAGLDDAHDLTVLGRSEIHTGSGSRSDWVWNELRFRDDGRDALTRTCLAQGGGRYAVLTFTLWADDAACLDPVWSGILDSLEVGVTYDLSGRNPRRN